MAAASLKVSQLDEAVAQHRSLEEIERQRLALLTSTRGAAAERQSRLAKLEREAAALARKRDANGMWKKHFA